MSYFLLFPLIYESKFIYMNSWTLFEIGGVMRVFYCKKRILKFKSTSKLVSDEDILNLFLGLVKLIKRNTEISIEEKYISQINQLQSQIKRLSK